MDELTRRCLVDRIENVILDYEERELSETDIESLNYDDLKCMSECLRFAQKTENEMWIPVSERLPDESKDYSVTYENGVVNKHWFVKECECWIRTPSSMKIIAWRELPEPYKE